MIRTAAVALLACFSCLAWLSLPSCASKPPASASTPFDAPPAQLPTEPTLRVRIVAETSHVQAASPSGLLLGPASRPEAARPFASSVRISRNPGAFIIQPTTGPAFSWAIDDLSIQPAGRSQALAVNGTEFPGQVVLISRLTQGRIFDVINHLPIETYLPGVLASELYDRWEPAAFEAQAIAARSYAIYVAAKNRDRHFDLEASVANQAYAGATSRPKPNQAVAKTRGLVLTWEGRILPAYYSSCTGGAGQDAVFAFPDGPDLPPLRGRDHGSFGSSSRLYRWGPIVRDSREVAARIAAWGRSEQHAVANLAGLKQVRVSARNSVGRPAEFELIDTRNQRFTLRPESFRFACNFEGGGNAKLAQESKLPSSFVNPKVVGSKVHFTEGRGHGHGVGLCQWGAQDIALKGHTFQQILAFYYPGAKLEHAYR